jgi:glycosyltransferase involved in cell wall biosynthesis
MPAAKPLIVLINHHSGLNGAELSFLDVVRNTDRNRFSLHVVLPSPGPLSEKINELNIPVSFILQHGWRWYYTGGFGRLKFIFTYPLIWRAIREYKVFFQRQAPSLVYLNINRIFVPLIAASDIGVPSIVHFRDIPSKVTHPFVLRKSKYFALLDKATLWIANSNTTKKDIQSWTSKEVKVVYNGFDILSFRKAYQNAPIVIRPARKKVIAMIGTLTPWKNQKDFIAMAERLRNNSELCFWIIGEGFERSRLEDQVKQANLQDVILFTGFVSPVVPLYSQIDVLVHTMPGESFGRVLVEAMIAQVPVVAYRSGAASELIEEESTGWLVDDFSVEGLADRVTFILAKENAAIVQRVTQTALQKATSTYSIERLSTEMNLIFADILKSSE